MIELGYIPNVNLDQMVAILLKYKEEGKQASAKFNGKTFYSDTVTLDEAYLEITGQTRDDYIRSQKEGAKQMKQARRKALETDEQRKARRQRLVEAMRVPGEEIEIDIDTVIDGLKFIYENPGLTQEQLLLGLLMVGCYFTYEDYHRQFPEMVGTGDVYDGLRDGELCAGADVIINVRDSEFGRSRYNESLKELVRRYIAMHTGDEAYGLDPNTTGAMSGGIKK